MAGVVTTYQLGVVTTFHLQDALANTLVAAHAFPDALGKDLAILNGGWGCHCRGARGADALDGRALCPQAMYIIQNARLGADNPCPTAQEADRPS